MKLVKKRWRIGTSIGKKRRRGDGGGYNEFIYSSDFIPTRKNNETAMNLREGNRGRDRPKKKLIDFIKGNVRECGVKGKR